MSQLYEGHMVLGKSIQNNILKQKNKYRKKRTKGNQNEMIGGKIYYICNYNKCN